jgi:hypothetical protein
MWTERGVGGFLTLGVDAGMTGVVLECRTSVSYSLGTSRELLEA